MERFSNTTRRRFLEGAAGLAGVVLASQLPSEALAAQFNRKPWTDKQWFPLKSGLRSDDGNRLLTLHEVGGPLHVYDEVHKLVFTDHPSHAREWAEDRANRVLSPDPNNPDDANLLTWKQAHPGAESWLGMCHALANAGMREAPPATGRMVADNAGQPNELAVDRITRLGLAVALHAGDVHFRHIVDTKTMDDLNSNLNQFIDWFLVTGEPFVVDLPEKPGGWYRVAYGVNGARSSLLVTNWGYGDKWMPRSMVKYVYAPFNLEEAQGQRMDPRLLAEYAGYRNPEISHPLARHLMSGLPLERFNS